MRKAGASGGPTKAAPPLLLLLILLLLLSPKVSRAKPSGATRSNSDPACAKHAPTISVALQGKPGRPFCWAACTGAVTGGDCGGADAINCACGTSNSNDLL